MEIVIFWQIETETGQSKIMATFKFYPKIWNTQDEEKTAIEIQLKLTRR